MWSLEQERNSEKSNYLKSASQDESIQSSDKEDVSSEHCENVLPVHVNRTQFKAQDVLVPWHLKKGGKSDGASAGNGATCLRYYHVFAEGELEKLIKSSSLGSQVRIVQRYYDKGNWCVVLEKAAQ